MPRRSGRRSPGSYLLVLVPAVLVVAGITALVAGGATPSGVAPASPAASGAGPTAATAPPTTPATDGDRPPPGPGRLHYVALGDSLASAGQGEASYVPGVARHLEQESGRRVDVLNGARAGWTTGNVLRTVRADEAVRRALADADVVTLNAGGNDLLPLRVRYGLGTCGGADGQACLRRGVRRFAEQWEELLDEVVAVRGGGDGVAVADLYHPFVSLERTAGTFPVTREHLEAANRRLRAAAAERGIAVADVYTAFNGPDGQQDAGQRGLVGIDGVHPTPKGAAAIAEAFAALQLLPLP